MREIVAHGELQHLFARVAGWPSSGRSGALLTDWMPSNATLQCWLKSRMAATVQA